MLRIHKQRARSWLIRALEAAPNVASIPDEWEDMIFVETIQGQHVVIYLYDRQIERDDVIASFIENTRQGIHTLYILSAAMLLPEHGEIYTPEDWMALLAALYGGKIYSYRVMRMLVDIAPAYFRAAGGRRVEVAYGEKVNVEGLQCMSALIDEAAVLVADFEFAFAGGRTTADTSPFAATGASTPQGSTSPDFTASDPFVVLGLPPDATRTLIKATFRDLARRYHPDVDRTPGAKTRMQALNQAYRVLMAGK